MTPSNEQALVAHQYLALRRAGLDALSAARGLSETLPKGPARRAALEATRRLSGPTESPAEDALTRMLSDASSGEAQAHVLARAHEVHLALDAARRVQWVVALAALTGAVLLPSAAAWFPVELLAGGVELPGPTSLLLSLRGATPFTALVAVGVLVALTRWRTAPVLGAHPLKEAQVLLDAALRDEPLLTLSAAAVSPATLRLTQVLATRMPPRDACAQVAERLASMGQRRVETVRTVTSLLVGFFLVWTLLGVLMAFYLPLFSIAGNIK